MNSRRGRPAQSAMLIALAVFLTVVAPVSPAFASHIEASSLALSDTGVGATSTYTLSYQVGAGNGALAAGQPKLRITFPSGTNVTSAGFDSASSGICACAMSTVDGTYATFPAYAAGGGFAVDASTRTITIGPLDTATLDGQTAFRIVLTGIVNPSTEVSTALTAEVTNAANATNTIGPVSFTVTGASASTGAATAIGATTVTLSGTASAPESVTITRRGVVLAPSTSGLPVVDDAGSVTLDAATAGTGTFSVDATGLTPETGYRYRAFIVSVGGTQYGLTQTFSTTAAPADPEPDPEPAPSTPVGDDTPRPTRINAGEGPSRIPAGALLALGALALGVALTRQRAARARS